VNQQSVNTFVAIDYHKSFSYGTIVDPHGQLLRRGRLDNNPEALREFLGEHGGAGCHAVLEATRNWTLMHDWLEEQVGQVTLAHPQKVRAIAEARVKTDRIDAATLAHLLRCDLIPAAHVSSKDARVLKNLLRHRMFLVTLGTMTKNRIGVLLDRHPQLMIDRPAGESYGKIHRAWLKRLPLPRDERRVLRNELMLLEQLNKRIDQANTWIKAAAKSDDRVQRLSTMPGLGTFLAMLVVAEIDDVNRFATPQKLHAYAGLVPSTYSSGGKSWHGRITKAGNRYLRWAMVEAVWPARRSDASINRFFQEHEAKIGTNKAKVATARRLLTIVYRLLKEQRDYRTAEPDQ
jgi:transposase